MLKPGRPAFALALAVASTALAQTTYPKIIPAPGGHVVITNAAAQKAYDEIRFAPARRAGDFLHISGLVIAPYGAEGRDVDSFKAHTRRAFRFLDATLKAEGLTFADVVMINTFHVWNAPGFKGTRDQQFEAFSAVKDEFMPPPHPAWTAVGTTELLGDNGVVEMQMIVYAPRPAAR
ncbi:Rid family hydrolase [Phenylobacterium sp.]|uniref:Rid family hydrolase n=1 Tax=Phenylobacterium sp. TaxID=1871053 RepID=UPI002ED92AF4